MTNIKTNLTLISQKMDDLKQSSGDKDKTIDKKNSEINIKEQELQQALLDVQEIERITEEMVR